MTKLELAKWLHENYEEVAKTKGWNTQENCKVDFDTLPEQNKQTMLEIADRLLNFNLLSQHFVSGSVCPCGELPDGEIAISSKALQKPYGDLGQTDA